MIKLKKSLSVFIFLILFLPRIQSLNSPPESHSRMNNGLSDLEYYDSMVNAFNLTSDELTLLEKNNFIVLNKLGTDDLLDAYRYYWEEDLPIIITTDAMLQAWHLIFDKILEQAEESLFFPLLRIFSLEMKETFTNQINVMENDLVVQDALIYLSVGAKLANPTVDIPSVAVEPTNQILNAIYDEITIFEAIEQFQPKATKRFIDDFTMYRPRGHYTRSENLKTYFRLFKWLSRIPFFFDEYPGEIYLNRSPEELVRSAIYLIYAMKYAHIKVDDLGIDAAGFDLWEELNRFFNVLVGETYMVAPPILDDVITSVKGTGSWHPDDINSLDIENIRNLILNDDTILSPKDPFIIDALVPLENWPEKLQATLSSCKSLLLFGERLALDTYAGNHLVYPFIESPWITGGAKVFPNGLEYATTVLQSERAHEYLSTIDHSQYQAQLNKTKQELEDWPSNEKQTLSWKWMEALKHLTHYQPEFNESKMPITPEFMKTSAWIDEKLTTILGSWAHLKHDTILYAKQGLGIAVCSTPEGYVEPYPQFYKALGQLTQLFLSTITQLDSLGFDSNIDLFNDIIYSGEASINNILSSFTTILTKLEAIAYHELQGKTLSAEDKDFVQEIYSRGFCGSASGQCEAGWLGELLGLLEFGYSIVNDQPNSRASLIADIHTDVNTEKILEVATGYLEHLLAIIPGWNGTDILAVGPVLSYYEFIIPMEYRMTDEDWRGVLITCQSESLDNNCIFPFVPRGFWAQSYMTSTEMTTSIIYEEEDAFEIPLWFLSGNQIDLNDGYPEEIIVDFIDPITYTIPTDPDSDSIQMNATPGFDFITALIVVTLLLVHGLSSRKEINQKLKNRKI